MKKVLVKSQQFNTATFERVGPMKEEIIDVETNSLFLGCTSLVQVRNTYESYWNNMGPLKNTPNRVIVKTVEKI